MLEKAYNWLIYNKICPFHSSQSALITWLFTERTKIVGEESDQDVCEHSVVTLSCNATGKPEPNITWTRVLRNGTDSGTLQSKDGYLIMTNISRSSNGTYRCTAFNGVGEPVNQTVTVIVRCKLLCLCNASFKLIETLYFTSVSNILFPTNQDMFPLKFCAWFNIKPVWVDVMTIQVQSFESCIKISFIC